MAINVAAMPENLLESELFGYEEGAFTGAKKGGRPGLFEFAHKGTLFLDEVEGMSQAMQVKLLRVLQEREIMRVGGNQIINVDVRIVAATNESLEEKVEEGSFRRDLYYRLNALPVLIPPLRERENDILLLIDHFRRQSGGSFSLSGEIRSILLKYSWPGNIRELQNVVDYFSFTGHKEVCMEDLPPHLSPVHAERPGKTKAERRHVQGKGRVSRRKCSRGSRRSSRCRKLLPRQGGVLVCAGSSFTGPRRRKDQWDGRRSFRQQRASIFHCPKRRSVIY